MDWLRKIPIGQYVSGESGWLRFIDPRLKIFWVLFFLLTPVLASYQWRVALVVILFALTFCSGIAIRVWWRSLSFLILLASIVGFFSMMLPTGELSADLEIRDPQELSISLESEPSWILYKTPSIKFGNLSLGPLLIDRRSAELGLKSSTLIFTVVHSVNLMLLTSPPEDLVWALSWFFSPLSAVGLPMRRISFQLLLALRFIPLVQEEIQNLIRSLSTRSISFKQLGFKRSFHLIISVCERLLTNILLRSQQGADALLARNGEYLPIGYLKPSHSVLRASFINLCSLLLLVIAFLCRFRLDG